MTAGIPIRIIDAFTDTPLSGNPAAVCLLEEPRPEEWMQAVATEMQLSETAFCHPEGDAFRLRWFTPETEVPLCGHATIATAHALWEAEWVAATSPCRFATASGLLVARADPTDWTILLDMPTDPVTPVEPPAGVLVALGLRDEEVEFCGHGRDYLLVVVTRAATVRRLKPDQRAIAALPHAAVIVSAAGDTPEWDVVSRFFAPAIGIPEDPVTGSAHCTLADYWMARSGRTVLRCRQESARGGTVQVRFDGDRVLLGGRAVTVVSGTLNL